MNIDRLVKTLKEMISKYRTIITKQGSLFNIIDKVIEVYDNQVHRTLKTTPSDMYKNVEEQIINHSLDKTNNDIILKNAKIINGSKVRILEGKGKLEKGSQKLSNDLYKLTGRDGNRFIVEDKAGDRSRRRLKPAELQVIKAVDNKIDRNNIEKDKADKKRVKMLIN